MYTHPVLVGVSTYNVKFCFLVPYFPDLNAFLEIVVKICRLGSRIRDMEAEWRLKVITDLIS